MDKLSFWKQKIVQFFHDPPAKPYAWYPGTGGHANIAKKLFEYFTGKPLEWYNKFPDLAASGADRPLLYAERGQGPQVHQRWHQKPLITHPLSEGISLDVRKHGEETKAAQAEIREVLLFEEEEVVRELSEVLEDWQDADQLKTSFVRLWRRYREELVDYAALPGKGDPLWEEMPADSRCPDHSIWDHLRVTTALAFLTRQKLPDSQEPWLFKFSIGPVQRFIGEARTGRDLWTGSFLLSDLIFHAMVPVIERYGPDCVVYPDLRGNPRVDCWLFEKDLETLPELCRSPSTFAAVLPNAFTAVLPRGAQNDPHLAPLEELAKESRNAVYRRWGELAEIVKKWLRENTEDHTWIETWDRQHRDRAVYTCWSAVAWNKPEKIASEQSLRARALPAQRPGFRQPPPENRRQAENDRKKIALRRDRLAPWMTPDIWAHYEWAREVFAFTNLNMHQKERGFDYALTHHQLCVRHKLRKAAAPDSFDMQEQGEICTVCSRRQALGPVSQSGGTMDSHRRKTREFWSHKRLDPEKSGSDRLCAVCAMKRFLVEAGKDPVKKELTGINKIWAGMNAPYDEVVYRDGRIRVPFPSTAAIAAQRYLEKIVSDGSLEPFLRDVVEAFEQVDMGRTAFADSLPRMKAASEKAASAGKDFLEIDTQMSLFPEAIEGRMGKPGTDQETRDRLESLKKTVMRLRAETAKRNKAGDNFGEPGKQLAVIMLDGDNMGRLLLGERQAVGARWKDILHPDAAAKILDHPRFLDAGWADLLDAKRLMGPSLHAFVSRALAGFCHQIVPWVVEREFSGRLIYAGGDDVLCLAPAEDALGLAARLQQLFSAPWIVDTDYSEKPWKWREKDGKFEYDVQKARYRFVVPRPAGLGAPIKLPVSNKDNLEVHAAMDEGDYNPLLPADGRLFPMLGPRASLSAGIVYGHYKTPLTSMMRQCRYLLNHLAKDRAGRRAVALTHFSRNGIKTEFAFNWSAPGERQSAHRCFEKTRAAFESGQLPARLPYKLRQIMPEAAHALRHIDPEMKFENTDQVEARDRLLEGLFIRALDGKASEDAYYAFELWKQGIRFYLKNPGGGKDEPECFKDKSERAVDGLLLARALSATSGGEP